MRILLILPLLAALAACTPNDPAVPSASATASTTDPGRNGRQGTWRRAERKPESLPMVWEYRSDLDPAQRASYKHLLVVSLIASAASTARPEARRQANDALERELSAALAGKGELVAVLDYYRQFDWYFYTNDTDLPALHAVVGKLVEDDVSITAEDDANGEFYTTLKERLGKTQ